MDGATLGIVGGIAGAVIGSICAFWGARASYRAATNDAQRRFYRQLFVWLVPIVILFVGLITLTSMGLLPRWVYLTTMGAWFGAMGPLIMWINRRLKELSEQ